MPMTSTENIKYKFKIMSRYVTTKFQQYIHRHMYKKEREL